MFRGQGDGVFFGEVGVGLVDHQHPRQPRGQAGEGLDRRTKASQLLEKLAVVVECDPLAGAGDAISWVRAEAASQPPTVTTSVLEWKWTSAVAAIAAALAPRTPTIW